jgi:hypothetical protein
MSSSIPEFDYLYNEADHSNITDAAIQQDKLGWHLFTSGKLIHQWEYLQQQYYEQLPNCHRNGKTWAKLAVKHIFALIQSMWHHRNQYLHNNTNPEYVTKQEEKTNKKVDTEFKKNINGIAPSEQHIFDTTQTEIMKLPICRKRQWIQSVKIARKRARVRNLNYTTPLFYSAAEEHSFKTRKRALSKSSHPLFSKWWLQHHPYLSSLQDQPQTTYISETKSSQKNYDTKRKHNNISHHTDNI